jgi:hypothetical protein
MLNTESTIKIHAQFEWVNPLAYDDGEAFTLVSTTGRIYWSNMYNTKI